MADSLIQAELLTACSGLGYSDGIKYHKEADCLETIKDLIRYLRRDDESHQIRRALGETKVLQTDLIPIIKFYSHDKELFDVTLRLLVNLTNPVLLLFKEELPEEKVMRQQYLQIIGHQQAFKEAFADEEVWKVLVVYLGEILDKEWEDREEEERLIVERVLILVRNILIVAASPEEEKRTDDDASVHDQVMWALHLARFEDLILYIASSNNEQDLCMHIIEIISLMLKEQDPSLLAKAGLQRSQNEKEKDENELLSLRRREAVEKQQKIKKHYNARHSRFGGTYVMNMKSISDRDMITHKPIVDIDSISFDKSKRHKKIPKNRQPLRDVNVTRRSTLAIRLLLQEFCIEFLNGAFNSLMYIVKDNLNRAKAQEHDETYYFWAMKFFLAFNRGHNFRVELITEALSIQSFHYIQTQLENYYETMTTDKKKISLWSRRMHNALNAYQELLKTLSFMDKSENSDVRESSKILKSKVFYVVEYREMVVILLQNYDEVKMSKAYLKDLIVTTHTFLKLLEGTCGKQRHLIVQKKAKVKGKRKNKKTTSKSAPNVPTEEELIVKWDELSDNLLAILKGESGELPTTIPFDSVSDTSEEEQKQMSMKKINSLLREGDLHTAVSLLRSSRDIWPEGDIFGAADIAPLEELLSLRLIFMANINDVISTEQEDGETDQENEDSDEEDEIQESRMSEQEFDFIGFVRRFAHIKIIQCYALCFNYFFTNSEEVNHSILKMFHRLAWDCKLVAIFFQASLFRTFQKIMQHPVKVSKDHRDAIHFIKFIVRKFVETAEGNDKVFVELLFWKNKNEAIEIECGYGTCESSKAKKGMWTEEEEEELKRLFEEFKEFPEEGKEIIDSITDNLINQNRNKRMVMRKLRELNLIVNAESLRKTVKARAPKEWAEEEILELRNLVEEYLDAIHPIDRILDHLTIKRPKNRVMDKILELGLVDDRKALQKKRVKSNKNKKSTADKFLEANEESSERESDESEVEKSSSIKQKKSNPSRKRHTKHSSELPILTPTLVRTKLGKVLENGLIEPVKWIADLLKETADEREEDGDFEPIPVVSITEECSQAMEDEDFQNLLKVIGLRPPADHLEMFWRIPSNLDIENLRKRSSFLHQGINEGITADSLPESTQGFSEDILESQTSDNERSNIPEEANISSPGSPNSSVENDDDISLSRLQSNPAKCDMPSSNPELSTSKDILQNISNTLQRKQKSAKRMMKLENADKNDTSVKKKRRIITEEEEEEEDAFDLLKTTTSPVTNRKDNRHLSRIYDSDEDLPVAKPTKRRVLLSDDSDDEVTMNNHSQLKIGEYDDDSD